MQESTIRSKVVVDTLIDLSEIISEGDDYMIPKEILAKTDPEFLRVSDEIYVSRRIVDMLGVLTRLYDKGYADSIKDTQELR